MIDGGHLAQRPPHAHRALCRPGKGAIPPLEFNPPYIYTAPFAGLWGHFFCKCEFIDNFHSRAQAQPCEKRREGPARI